ncbi:agamous-like mads-box protein agl80-like [Trifolium pratense]|uniref:Agamous-like mads-box protein agl80-like n=1 Tax=Trifolium pratense TaxID=57577 RepID=A0A2K3LYC9_TRIPR|nr:agamous-like mads-box protein agl80-like [Trifolium pratense]
MRFTPFFPVLTGFTTSGSAKLFGPVLAPVSGRTVLFGLLKKVNELSILCGVEACIIIYPENSAQPDIWPPGLRTRNVLGKFMSLPELERNKKMLDSEGFANQTLEKTQKILMKQIEKNQKKSGIFISDTYKNLECDTRDLNINEANNWKGFIEKRLNEVEQKLISIKIQAEEETENGIEAVNGIANLGHVADV